MSEGSLEEGVPILVPLHKMQTLEEDPDEIIPPRFSRPLVFSAALFLVLAALSLAYAQIYDWPALYPVCPLATLLFITSVWHWHRPRFSTRIRRIDYLAVALNVAYASYIAITLSRKYMTMWFVGLSIIAIVFCFNELAYYWQCMRNVDGSGSSLLSGPKHTKEEDEERTTCLPRTKPNTEERNRVYQRTVFVHCVGVHCCASSLALALIIGGERQRQLN